MFETILTIIFYLLASFTVCHYVLSLLWKNSQGVLIVSAVFAVLFVIFTK